MKILITTTSFPLFKSDKTNGGFVYNQAEQLVLLGHKVYVLAPDKKNAKKKEIINNINIKRFTYFWPKKHQTLCYGSGIPENLKKGFNYKIQLPFLCFAFFINCLFKVKKIDIIIAHWTLSALPAILTAKIFKKKVILMEHHGYANPKKNFLINYIFKNVDHVVFNSHFTMKTAKKLVKINSNSVISPIIDTQKFKPIILKQNSHFFNNLKIACNFKIVFAMGRHISWKGYNYLIESFSLINNNKVLLVIGGSGPLTFQLKKQAENLNISNKIIFLGNIRNDLTPLLYNRASVFIQPSITDYQGHTEGLGMTVMEALSCGTPCIGFNSGGISDLIIDGYNGFLVEPKNVKKLASKIEEILFSSNINFSINARKFILQNFSITENNKKLIELFKTLKI
jgi:glycosyltransferase involved in cell wall biosynthesis